MSKRAATAEKNSGKNAKTWAQEISCLLLAGSFQFQTIWNFQKHPIGAIYLNNVYVHIYLYMIDVYRYMHTYVCQNIQIYVYTYVYIYNCIYIHPIIIVFLEDPAALLHGSSFFCHLRCPILSHRLVGRIEVEVLGLALPWGVRSMSM